MLIPQYRCKSLVRICRHEEFFAIHSTVEVNSDSSDWLAFKNVCVLCVLVCV